MYFLPLIFIILLVGFVWFVVQRMRPLPTTKVSAQQLDQTRPQSFGYKTAWMAFKATDAKAVVKALRIQQAYCANWATGLQAALDNGLFISPPLQKEWVLIVGWDLPNPQDEQQAEQFAQWLTGLSQQFGEVQYFASHRVAEYYAWMRAREGKLLRSFCYMGETSEYFHITGEADDTEKQLGMGYNSVEEAETKKETSGSPDEETVQKIAAHWSVNTQELHTITEKATGWVGSLLSQAIT